MYIVDALPSIKIRASSFVVMLHCLTICIATIECMVYCTRSQGNWQEEKMLLRSHSNVNRV